MKRTHTTALLILLAVASLPALTTAANVSVSSVNVTPQQPVPGDDITIEPTVENLQSSSAGFAVDRIVLEENKDDDPEEFARVENLGVIGAGSSRTVPLTTSFDETGTYDLRVRVVGQDTSTGRFSELSYPVFISVEDRAPQLAVEANDSAVGVRAAGSMTVANSLDSPIENVEVTVSGEDVRITDGREVLATLDSGASQTVAFNYRADSPGEHRLRAELDYTTTGGTSGTVTESVVVQTEDVHPQIDVDTNDSIAGVDANGTVTVANGLGAAVTNAELTVEGDGVRIRNDREVFTRIDSGASSTTSFDFRPTAAGDHELTATLRYTTNGGTTRTTTETVTVAADPLRDRVGLDVSTRGSGTDQSVTVDVLNQGNAPLTNVSVRGTSTGATVQRALVSRVAPGDSRTVRLNATLSRDSAAVDIEATYEIAQRTGSTTASTALTQSPGRIGLTGVEVVPEGGQLRISGTASNLGSTDAESVLVSVVETERVTPASPNPEIFIGPVPASDFAAFDVYATTEGNVSTVPLRVSYLVDGERRNQTVEVDTASASRSLAVQQQEASGDGGSGGNDGGGGGILVPAAIGVVVVLAVVAVMVRAWRASRGGD